MVDDWGREIAEVKGRISALDHRVRKVEKWVEEDSPEFHQRMEKFVNHYEGAEEAREKLATERHHQNLLHMEQMKHSTDRWNLVVTIIGLIISVCLLYLTGKSVFHAKADPSEMFHSQTMPKVDAKNVPQEAIIPTHP
jgi:hypothetical protein